LALQFVTKYGFHSFSSRCDKMHNLSSAAMN